MLKAAISGPLLCGGMGIRELWATQARCKTHQAVLSLLWKEERARALLGTCTVHGSHSAAAPSRHAVTTSKPQWDTAPL